MSPEVRQKAAFWLALVFILGLATGGVFGYSFAHSSYASGKLPAPQMSDADKRAKKVAEMTSEVGLTQEQAQKADAVIAMTQGQMKAVRDKAPADVDALRHEGREKIRAFLPVHQKRKFEE